MTPIARVQPTTDEVLDALAFEIFQHDALRDACGKAPRNGLVTFTEAERGKAREMGPRAHLDESRNLVFTLDS